MYYYSTCFIHCVCKFIVKMGVSMYVDKKVGQLTAKYETSGRGPGFISNGMGGKDPGGISYGSYQLESKKGTLQAYLKTSDKFTDKLRRLKVNSQEFMNMWRQLAKEDPEGFETSQFNYLANKPNGYVDGYNWAKANGWAVNDLAMQSAIYSAVNQSGGWRNFFRSSGISPSDSIEVQLDKLYDARAAYFRSLKTLTPDIKDSIIKNRTINERKDAKKLIGL